MGSPVTVVKHGITVSLSCDNAVSMNLPGCLQELFLCTKICWETKASMTWVECCCSCLHGSEADLPAAGTTAGIAGPRTLHLCFGVYAKNNRISGVLDHSVRAIHQKRQGMLKAAEKPLFSIVGLLLHLIVARLLDPVHVSHWTQSAELPLLLPP